MSREVRTNNDKKAKEEPVTKERAVERLFRSHVVTAEVRRQTAVKRDERYRTLGIDPP
ncbi:MAG: hypothetical protein ISR99_00075 [Parcubacteria group bacterium]|nr:hypothetical protein [Parcubacteria group bacterium]